MSQHTEDSQPYRRVRRAFLAAHPVCWICGHLGADQIDHVIPRSVRRTRLDTKNWRAAHGTRGCPSCRRKCNQERGTKPIEEVEREVFRPAHEW